MSGKETDFAWLIEAPGNFYLAIREIGRRPEFFWTEDHTRALRLFSETQAADLMGAIRALDPDLFAFAVNLRDAGPAEHAWAYFADKAGES